MDARNSLNIVYIEWIDSQMGDQEWLFKQDVANTDLTLICSTVGYVVKDTKEYVTIAHTITDLDTENFQMLVGISIPKVAIKVLRYFTHEDISRL